MRARLHGAARWALYECPGLRRLGRGLRPRALVLAYHRVADTAFDPYGQAVTPATFARQLALLRRDYHVLPLDELLRRLERRDYRDRTVAVTFDDGYLDSLTAAQPIAREQGVPITIFVAAQPVLSGGLFWWDALALAARAACAGAALDLPLGCGRRITLAASADADAVRRQLHRLVKRLGPAARQQLADALSAWARGVAGAAEVGRPMTPAELCRCAGLPGVTIGAHTLTHPALAQLPRAEQLHELVAGRRVLAELLGRPVDLLAYPFGKPADVSPATRALAARAGYRAGLTTSHGTLVPGTDRFAVPRLTVHEWTDDLFAARVGALFGEAR
jgi:peptidoglycan/xylan/chitin deacetylase (PgdA/CDA1 family)